ncbi:hypothetical protein CR513_40832, partial [Mucuna pruriens]
MALSLAAIGEDLILLMVVGPLGVWTLVLLGFVRVVSRVVYVSAGPALLTVVKYVVLFLSDVAKSSDFPNRFLLGPLGNESPLGSRFPMDYLLGRTDLESYIEERVEGFSPKPQVCMPRFPERESRFGALIGRTIKLECINLKHISKLHKMGLVKGLPEISSKTHLLCEACQKGKQVKTSFKVKNVVSTSRPLELLHVNLFGPMRMLSLGVKKYGFVIVDDYSIYT